MTFFCKPMMVAYGINQQGLKPIGVSFGVCGTTEVVPCYKAYVPSYKAYVPS